MADGREDRCRRQGSAAALVVAGIVCAALSLSPLAASQPDKPPRGSRVAVVAYHDSRLLTLCPVLGKDVIESSFFSSGLRAAAAVFYPPPSAVSGMQSLTMRLGERQLARLWLPMPAGQTVAMGPHRASAQPHELDRLARDLDLEARFGVEFRTRGFYSLVESPDQADFVFLAESTAISFSGGTPDSSGPTSVNIGGAGPSFVGILGGDRPLNWRQSIIAVAVPGDTYRLHAGDGAALAAGRVWQGLEVSAPESGAGGGRTMKAASPENLVDRFHARGQGLPDYLPVCAATAGVIQSIDDAPGRSAAPDAPAPDSPGAPGDAVTRTGSAPRFRSDVTMVMVPVTVVGRNGELVTDLPMSAFRVFEDDVAQPIARLDRGVEAADVALLVDTSAGMRAPREHLQSSASAFAAALRSADRAMVVKFGSRVQVLSEFTSDRTALQAALAQAGPGGGTRLYDALALVAVERLNRTARTAVVLLTDGIDTQSQLTNDSGALAAIQSVNAPAFVVRYDTPDVASRIPSGAYGIGRWLIFPPDAEKEGEARAAADRFLARLSAETGGRLYAALPDAAVPEVIAHIGQELSNQTVLAYYPTNGRLDGTYRKIRVTVDCDGCTLRARSGYRAGNIR